MFNVQTVCQFIRQTLKTHLLLLIFWFSATPCTFLSLLLILPLASLAFWMAFNTSTVSSSFSVVTVQSRQTWSRHNVNQTSQRPQKYTKCGVVLAVVIMIKDSTCTTLVVLTVFTWLYWLCIKSSSCGSSYINTMVVQVMSYLSCTVSKLGQNFGSVVWDDAHRVTGQV